MANKREFKKSVEALSSALVDEMMVSFYNVKDADQEKISNAISAIVEAMGKAVKTSNALFHKGVKEFENIEAYNKAKTDFTKEKYHKAIEEYNDALTEALKVYNEAMPKNTPSPAAK